MPDFHRVRPTNENAVILFRQGDRWIVSVVENGAVASQDFLLERFARSYADGQCVRLGFSAPGEPTRRKVG